MIWTLAVLPIALLLLGTPIFGIFLIGAVATFVLFLSVPPVALHQIMFGGMENYALLAVPFFIFAGELMSGSGIAQRLIVWVLALSVAYRAALGLRPSAPARSLVRFPGRAPRPWQWSGKRFIRA